MVVKRIVRRAAPVLVALAALSAAPGAAHAAGEPGAVVSAGSTINGVAAEPGGTVLVAGADGSNQLVQRIFAAGTTQAPFSVGAGTAVAVATQSDGSFVVVGDDGSGTVVRRFTLAGDPDATFGLAGTARITGLTPTSLAIGPAGVVLVGGNVSGSDGFPRAAVVRLLRSGAPDTSFSKDATALPAVGRNARVNGIAVGRDGKVVVAGQTAPGLRTTAGFVARLTSGGAADAGFAKAGVYRYDAQGSALATMNGVVLADGGAMAGDGKLTVVGSDLQDSGFRAVFLRLTDGGALDPSFGEAGILRTPASENTTSTDPVGPLAVSLGGGGEVVASGVTQRSGQRSSTLWALTPAGQLDANVGTGGVVTSAPGSFDATESRALAITPDGNLFAGGLGSKLSGADTGLLRVFGGFGPLTGGLPFVDTAPAPDPSAEPVPPAPARLQIQGARIDGPNLVVLASLTTQATGKVRVVYQNRGSALRFDTAIPQGAKVIRIVRRLPHRSRRGGGGVVTLGYGGSPQVLAESARLRVGRHAAQLRRKTSGIDQSGFLTATGTIAGAAKGVVLARLTYRNELGTPVTLDYRGPIRRGSWRVEVKLPDDAAAAGGQLTLRYTGMASRAIRGEQLTKILNGIGGQ